MAFPQPPQNWSFGSFSNPQEEHGSGNAEPQAEQNFLPALFSL
jgi:hypothetical protein